MTIQPREFESARDMLAHYAAIREGLRNRSEPPPPPPPNVRFIETKPYIPPHLIPKKVLPPIREGENTGYGRIRYIVRATCIVRRISVDDLGSMRKHQWRVHARWLCWFVIKEITGKSFPEIGRAIPPGHQFDHTTVYYGIQNVAEAIASGDGYMKQDRAEIFSMAVEDMIKAGLRLPLHERNAQP